MGPSRIGSTDSFSEYPSYSSLLSGLNAQAVSVPWHSDTFDEYPSLWSSLNVQDDNTIREITDFTMDYSDMPQLEEDNDD